MTHLKRKLAWIGLSVFALLGILMGFTAEAADFVVAADGSGDFRKVQDAIDAVPKNQSIRTTIFIQPGTYKEKIRVPSDAINLSLLGESSETTILTFNNYGGKTSDYASTRVMADGFYAENVTFQNTIDSRSGIDGGQAAALRMDGDRSVFFQCRIMGFQDTYYTGGNNRSYHKDCRIEGTTDFIYGDGIAMFEACTIVCRKNSTITAHSQKLKNGKHVNQFGYVFQNCKIEKHADEDVTRAALGRPWGNAARVVFLNCDLGSHIRAEGWSPWKGRPNHQTAYYAEYKNHGPGSQSDNRLPWTHQLTDEEAAEYTKENIFKARNTTAVNFDGDWIPKIELLRDSNPSKSSDKPRVIVTSDGEIDDECSMVRFLLYANQWDIEGIVTSSSQYHWHGHKWAGDDWVQPYLKAYAAVHPNLIQHDSGYPTADFLQARTFLGNVKTEGEMDEITPGSQHIARVLLDESDDRPIWIQAWGGTNTIARALKTIEDDHPDKMAYVAQKLRFFFIWEQDSTYQSYIRPHWGKYNIPTIISDQFIAIFYHWKKYLPAEQQTYFAGQWMKQNVLADHGPLCSLYQSHTTANRDSDEGNFVDGDFRSEGDSPAFLHTIPTGLRSLESPDWGGWGGRYTRVRDNTWLDPVADPTYEYPAGRWYGDSAWGRVRLRQAIPDDRELTQYLKPIWRWTAAMQNDFAARADWCVEPFDGANHPPVVTLTNPLDFQAPPGTTIPMNAEETVDPDNDLLTYRWWQYQEAGTYGGAVEIQNAGTPMASVVVPDQGKQGQTIHVICEVTDNGTPALSRYQRVVIEIQ
ncbi:Pectinesterase A precursor [Rubripirellula lacrimiformis]|uniref:Pectinesterase A n=1 Tax=Rubripirellula lacrimiformis TaxID=1930273 RepID=A0A517N973_9BACT|nr:pectinesterase family protein [Rubripirellula lacrimiformis]QDT03683.1 Pectinesterase A precursor [Rubripirellula lacrimiformis]